MARFRSAAFVLTALFLAGCASDPNRDTALSHEGQDALHSGDLKTAESRLKEALEVNPDNPHALTDLSTVYIRQARYDDARPLCQRVIDHEADYEKAAKNGDDSKEMARVVQLARDNLAEIDKGQTEEQELLALTPDGAPPAAAPLVRQPAAPAATVTASAPETVTSAPVAPEAPTSKPAATAAAAAPVVTPASFHYRIQVGAFKSRVNAERLAQRLRERQAEAMRDKEVRFPEMNGLVKVQIGPYASLKEASEACRTFTGAGLRCFPKGHD